jgi:hypothetical protein
MKLLLVFLLTGFSGTLMARQTITRPVQPQYPLLVKKDTIRPMMVDPNLRLQRMEGRYSHTTSKGKIYLMAPDNMPCLVPDDKNLAPMPGSRHKLRIKPVMPNALPVVPLIPNAKS